MPLKKVSLPMLKPVSHLVLAILFTMLSVIGSTARPGILTWTGCDITNRAFMADIAGAYLEQTGTLIKLSGGCATHGIRSAATDTIDLGGTCRHWLGGTKNKHPKEKDAQLTQVAWDALVVIVHPDNMIDNISLDDLKNVYEGRITSWKELGGPDKPIRLVTRERKYSGVGYMFNWMVFKNPEYEVKAPSLKKASSGPLEEIIAKTIDALGVTGISSASRQNVKTLSLDGIIPSKKNITSGTYPFFRPLYIAIGPNSSPESRKVIEFILSPAGQGIISKAGTVNLEEGKALTPLWDDKKKDFGL